MKIYVPFLPKSRFSENLQACQKLRLQGYDPVPHVPARSLSSSVELGDWLGALTVSGVDKILLIAGDRKVTGPFANTLDVIDSGILSSFPLKGIGVAGHPEGHPAANTAELTDALMAKKVWAAEHGIDMWVMTQFVFEHQSVTEWLESQHEVLSPLPVIVGLPGPVQLKTLIAYAAHCGVGSSAKVLKRRPGAARLLRAWKPDGVIGALAKYHADNPDSMFQGIHIFPFGGLQRSAEWLRQMSLSG